MSLLGWIKTTFGIGGKKSMTDSEIEAFANAAVEVCVRELAFQTAVNLLASAVSRCEFRTYKNGKITKGDEYYLWNVRPNRNQSKDAFIHKLIYQMCRRNHALIIEMSSKDRPGDPPGLYVADDFSMEQFAIMDYRFTNVTVDGYTFNRTFYMSDVIYLNLHFKDVNQVLGLLYNSYGKLLASGMQAYRRGHGLRSLLKISTQAQKAPDFEKVYTQLTGTDLKKFMTADTAVLPQYEGYEYTELGNKTYAAESSRDIKAMVDDIFEFTAKAFNIPVALMKGEIADSSVAVDNLITFPVNGIIGQLAEEINAKRNGRQNYLAGTKVEICSHLIRHVDLWNMASNIEKLVSSGIFSVNDVLAMLGEPTIDEPWAKQHFITKNYASVEEFLSEIKGKGGE